MGPAMASKSQELDVLENWEEIEETDVLDKKFGGLITSSRSLDSKSNGNLEEPLKIILTGEDALRTQYVPPEPTVKILKRPSQDLQNNSDCKVYQPKKTLQQRKQEYAEARLRILGEASSDKLDETVESTKIIQKLRFVEDANVIRLPKGPDGTNGFNIRR
ncbi:SUZ RNA-binding domain-containing isoform X2 [Leptinotarsa decemlineata]|uniref:SUZ RNA-binding domain-containing isoform X2 n=1 Tax=Leptinotarsa decemlineata TaxID=7539 RepID=UPI000C253F50|nr:SUZ domain-containing protein 1 isoform X2 [Leptinotarsa decemlineata]